MPVTYPEATIATSGPVVVSSYRARKKSKGSGAFYASVSVLVLITGTLGGVAYWVLSHKKPADAETSQAESPRSTIVASKAPDLKPTSITATTSSTAPVATPLDQVAEFKELVPHFISQLVATCNDADQDIPKLVVKGSTVNQNSNTFLFPNELEIELDSIEIDVKKSDSLISPYIGLITCRGVLHYENGPVDLARCEFLFTFAYRNEWVIQSGDATKGAYHSRPVGNSSDIYLAMKPGDIRFAQDLMQSALRKN